MTQPVSQPGEAQPGQWFFALNNQQHGPVDIEDVRAMLGSGTLGPESLVWTAGMAEWLPTAMVPELSGVVPSGPRQLQYGLTAAHYDGPGGAEYATFGLRFVALIIDSIVLQAVTQPINLILRFGLPSAGPPNRVTAAMLTLNSVIGICIGWLYSAFMESSTKQATLGKMAMGLIVTDLEGRPITFGRATGRYFGKMVSSMTCLIGYLMVLWTEKRQALHDIMASTLVLKRAKN